MIHSEKRKELNLSEEKSRAITQAIEETLIDELKNTDRQTATKIDIEQLRSEIKETKAELLKWFVGLFITLMLMVLGLYATILLN